MTDVKTEDLAEFIGKAIGYLRESATNCRLPLDDNLALYVGWSDGYEKTPQNPDGYAMACKIANMNDALWCDFDFCDQPYDAETGEVYDTHSAISDGADYTMLANYYLDAYRDIVARAETGQLVI